MNARTALPLLFLSPLLLGACLVVDDDAELGTDQIDIAGGTLVPTGQLEAIGQVSGRGTCTATLVSDRVVLTAAHCMCDDVEPYGCVSSATFTLRRVRPVDDPATATNESLARRDVPIAGTVVVHPDYGIGAWLANDLAMVRLARPASEVALVSPIAISSTRPKVGDKVTMVGFGGATGPGGECAVNDGRKRRATTAVDAIVPAGVGDLTLVMNDDTKHVCSGDSGGPALDAGGRVVGVASNSNLESNSGYKAVDASREWIGLQRSSPGGRVGVWDLTGDGVATSAYADTTADPLGLLGWIDADDLRLTGDFFARGQDQVLYVNRGGAGGLLRIASYADGVGPTDSVYWESYGDSTFFSGWLDHDDVHLVGDFLGRGHEQLLLMNRSGVGGRLMIVDFASGAPQVGYYESHGEDVSLNGWENAEDGFLVGDFMGDGHDQVLFVNRGVGAGRILIADFSDGQAPIAWRYYEGYADGPQLNAWHDADDLLLAGDFRGLGRDQVMFINRGPGDGRVLVTDFSGGAFPAAWHFYKPYAEAGALSGFVDPIDVAFAGDFRGLGHDQVAFVNRDPTEFSFSPLMVADFSGGEIATPFFEGALPGAAAPPRLQWDDEVLAGDVRGLGRRQIVTLERLEQ